MKHPNHAHIEIVEHQYESIEMLFNIAKVRAEIGFVVEAIGMHSRQLRRKIYSYREALRKKGIHEYDNLAFHIIDNTRIKVTLKNKLRNPIYDVPFIAYEPIEV